jgi:hypothetical protein
MIIDYAYSTYLISAEFERIIEAPDFQAAAQFVSKTNSGYTRKCRAGWS